MGPTFVWLSGDQLPKNPDLGISETDQQSTPNDWISGREAYVP